MKTALTNIDFTDKTGFTGLIDYNYATTPDGESKLHGNCLFTDLDISGWSKSSANTVKCYVGFYADASNIDWMIYTLKYNPAMTDTMSTWTCQDAWSASGKPTQYNNDVGNGNCYNNPAKSFVKVSEDGSKANVNIHFWRYFIPKNTMGS